MRSALSAIFLIAMVNLAGAAYANGATTFATYVDASSGNLNGVAFTMSGLSTPGFGSQIQLLDMADADWNSVGSQSGVIYNQNTANSFTITFESPVSGVELYLYYFRGTGAGGGGYSSYTISTPFTVTGGLTNVDVAGNTLDTNAASFANGVIAITGPVSSLTVSGTGTAMGGDAGFALAMVDGAEAVPVPVTGVGGILLLSVVMLIFGLGCVRSGRFKALSPGGVR